MTLANTLKLIATLTLTISITACSISPKVQAVQIGDEELSKQELLTEMQKLDQAERKVSDNKGVNVTNVAAALFWLPGLAVTMIDAHEATNLIHERRTHITNIYNKKYRGGNAVASSKPKDKVA